MERQPHVAAEVKSARNYTGLDIFCTDHNSPGGVNDVPLTSLNALEWFASDPAESSAAIRLLVHRFPSGAPHNHEETTPNIPFAREIVEHATWAPQVYRNLARSLRGGTLALLDNPWRFVLQTQVDSQPFVSLALSKHGNVVKGVYMYNHPDLDPAHILEGQDLRSSWRSDGLQILSLPQAVLEGHSRWLDKELHSVSKLVQSVETALLEPGMHEYHTLRRVLQQRNDHLFTLERRSWLESQLIEAIESIRKNSPYGEDMPSPNSGLSAGALELRQLDFQVLPR